MTDRRDVLFLGGHDLEMVTIAEIGRHVLGPERVADDGLSWGARASQYEARIRAEIDAGRTPVLVELPDDLPADMDRSRLVFIDHHNERAGRDRPSALRQIAERYGIEWSRDLELVEANDIGHIARMKELGASAREIRDIRCRDRRAQGVTPAEENKARHDIAGRRIRGQLTIVETQLPSSTAVGDLIEPELGGPGADNLLVLMPEKVAFFGRGDVVLALNEVWPGGWYGGALPVRGYWGAEIERGDAQDQLQQRAAALLS